MKQFIYLDTDMVNSIIAQTDKGLVLDTVCEHEDTTGDNTTKGGSATVNGSVGSGIWKFAQAQAEFNGKVDATFSNHSQTLLKEIATKTLHDAAFDIAYEQICKEWDTNPANADIGVFIELKSVFSFVDLEFIDGLFSGNNAFMDFMKNREKQKITDASNDEISQHLNRQEQRANERQVKQRINALTASVDKKFDDMSEIIKAMRQIVPYKRVLVSTDGYIIPLEDKYFRDNPQTLGFKHGGKVTCVGYITNVIGETATSLATDPFSQLQHLANRALITTLQLNAKDLFVVHPIAVYYGQ